MSRVYFHSEHATAELRGSERAWLGHIAHSIGDTAWGLDPDHPSLERAEKILALIPEVPEGEYGANYLHRYLRQAQAQREANHAALEGWRPGQPPRGRTDYEPERNLMRALRTALNGVGGGPDMLVAGVSLGPSSVSLNTALALGSDPVRLAAKIHGWCEVHAWIDGPDRAWAADIIQQGLDVGVYRRGFWFVDGINDTGRPADEHPSRKWSSQGWEEVQALLRERDDEPVVMSYSVCDQFPSERWHPEWPGREVEKWGDYTEAEQEAVTAFGERWYETLEADPGGVWDACVGRLRERSWGRISPETLGRETFGPGVTIYDLFAADRDERVRAAQAREDEPVVPDAVAAVAAVVESMRVIEQADRDAAEGESGQR